METTEGGREPCPDRILDDTGGAFGMGIVGGSAFHFIKGIYNSPAGLRLSGGAQAVQMNAPRIGGSFAVWGALFSTFDCALVFARQKEDPWNSILSGVATGGIIRMRQGFGASAGSALFGGAILALMEGFGIVMNKVVSASQSEQFIEDAASVPSGVTMGQPVPEISSGSRSWFGKGKKKEPEDNSGSKTQILESF